MLLPATRDRIAAMPPDQRRAELATRLAAAQRRGDRAEAAEIEGWLRADTIALLRARMTQIGAPRRAGRRSRQTVRC